MFQFPAAPTIGQVFAPSGGPTYKWNGKGWAPFSSVYDGGLTFTAPVLFADGTLSAPGISWANETNSGFTRGPAGTFTSMVRGAHAWSWTATQLNLPATTSLVVLGPIAILSGQTRHGDGTQAAPAISWSTETNSGFYRSSLNNFQAVVAGAHRWGWNDTTFFMQAGTTFGANTASFTGAVSVASLTASGNGTFNDVNCANGVQIRGSVASYPNMRFTSDNWRLEFNATNGTLSWLSYASANLFSISSNGSVTAANRITAGEHFVTSNSVYAARYEFNNPASSTLYWDGGTTIWMQVQGQATWYSNTGEFRSLKAFNCTASITADVNVTAANDMRARNYYIHDADYHLYANASQVYTDMAPGWYWRYERATGNLTWNTGSGNGSFQFHQNGNLYLPKDLSVRDVSCQNVYAAGNLSLIGSDYPYPKISFSSDRWRLEWNANNGDFSFMQPNGTNLLRVSGGGDCIVLNNLTAAGSYISTGRYHTSGTGGVYFTNSGYYSLYALEGNPAHSHMIFRFQHEGGVWAGFQLYVGSQGGDFRLHASGRAEKSTGAGQWEGTSDIRLKQNVRALEYGLKEVMALKPITYEIIGRKMYDDSEDPTLVGLSAQDAEVAMPRMVYRRPDKDLGEVLGVKPDYVQYAMVNAIKELNERLTALEAK